MMRMEMACFFVIMIMSILYFSAKREKTQIHKIFSLIMLLSMFHLVFDAVTVYTVNRRDIVPVWINEGAHRLFIGTMVLLFYLFYRYIALLIEEETGKVPRGFWFFTVILGVTIVGALCLPIYYMDTELGSYSYGPAAYMTYFSVAVNLFGVIFAFAKHWKEIYAKKKLGIAAAMAVEVVISLYQATHPLALLSGMGIMLIVLSFYLTMENPDILLVKQIEKEKQRAETANEAKSTFLSHMSHEIRTPMNAVIGMTELMLRTDITNEQREYLVNIKHSGNALVSIINDILDISKIESGKMELSEGEYEVAPMLSDVRMIIENRIGEKPIELLFEIDERVPKRMYGDDLRIRQVMINLLNNAVKFTEKGHVELKIEVLSLAEEKVQLKVIVSDTGRGIRKEDLDKLFGAFEQVDVEKNKGKEGTGLGLAISSELVRLMGGKLEVDSVYGVGSRFCFTINQGVVVSEYEEEIDEQTESREFTAPNAKILVVDDSEINLKVATGLMKPLQMTVHTALSGQQALEMIRREVYDIIFMDHMMPGMDGIETTERIRAMEDVYYREVPIIAFSANAMKEAEQSFYACGMDGFVSKPIEVDVLFRVMRKWLPKHLIREAGSQRENVCGKSDAEDGEFVLEGISVQEGVKNAGSTEFYMEILADFYLLIDTKSLKIEKCIEDELIRDYTVEVHALKSTARMIGAMELSDEFLHLEQLGKEEDWEAIRRVTPEVLAHYRRYKEILKPFSQQREQEKREASMEEILDCLKAIGDAIDKFDLDGADEAMKRLETYKLPQQVHAKMEDLRVYMADVAMEDILRVTHEIEDMIGRIVT
ncbi:MAG: response regulator [Lachnospiraceae bacterium]|nr:response regulator [Lachnospiraceae bacterium]